MVKQEKEIKRVIWSSDLYTNEEERDSYIKDMREDGFEVTEKDWDEVVSTYLEDERSNLNKRIDGVIIAFASLGLWNGRKQGYKQHGDNIKNILYSSCDGAEWYGDGKNIRSIQTHHDGTNYIIYRIARSKESAEKICEMIYNGEIDEAGFIRRTKSLYKEVAKIYGWE